MYKEDKDGAMMLKTTVTAFTVNVEVLERVLMGLVSATITPILTTSSNIDSYTVYAEGSHSNVADISAIKKGGSNVWINKISE